MIIRMLYVLPMILGRTYDIRTQTVGVDIFSLEDVQTPKVFEEPLYLSTYKTVESSSDVKEILQINGDMSLNIKAGFIGFGGFGAYVKSTLHSRNSIEILIKVSFRTVSKSLPLSARPITQWQGMGKEHLGTHFVQSILYGGDLIASLRFKATTAEDLQDVRATVKSFVSTGDALELLAGGTLETLDKKLERKATMEISYFATVPIEGVPNTLEGLRQVVKNFEEHVKKVNNGLGAPVEVELAELSTFNKEFEHIRNVDLETELQFFEEYFDDLLRTKSSLSTWLLDVHGVLEEEDEKQISKLNERVMKVLNEFSSTIANLDLEMGASQLNAAKEAYKEGKQLAMAGKFQRELNRLLKKVVLKSEFGDQYTSVYTHYGSRECEQDADTFLVHSGYVASAPRNEEGAGYNYLCLPKNPKFVTSSYDHIHHNASIITGVKYGLLKTTPFAINGNSIVLKGVVCAVCLVQRQTLFTFYGQKECPDQGGWKLHYVGYLMAASDVERSENVCVDTKMDSHQDSYMGQHDQSLDFVLVSLSGTSDFVPCVVCSK